MRDSRTFLLWFLALLTGYYVACGASWVDRRVIYRAMRVTTKCAARLMALREPASVDATKCIIYTPQARVYIWRGCDPCDPMMLCGAAILAYPSTLRRKLAGWAVALPLIFALNLVRIVTCAWRLGHGDYYFLHEQLWPAVVIVAALALWLVWLPNHSRNEENRK